MNKKFLLALSLLIFFNCICVVSASVTIDVSTSDTFYFYSTDNLVAADGYFASVVVDGSPYYLDDSKYDELCDYSPIFAEGFLYQFQPVYIEKYYRGGNERVGQIIYPGNTVGDFELNVDKEFSFRYKTGEVGLNKHAYIITDIYIEY